MTLGCLSQCVFCRHLHDHIEPEKNELGCAAFPDGVPRMIYAAGFDHRQAYPYEDDHGIRFEPTNPAALARYEAIVKAEGRAF